MRKFVVSMLALLLLMASLTSALAMECPKCGANMYITCSRRLYGSTSYTSCTKIAGCQKRNVYYWNKYRCNNDGSEKTAGNHWEKIEHRYCDDIGKCRY